MATKAYLLVETAIGSTRNVARALEELKADGVDSVDVVTGPYDIIATLKGRDAVEVGSLVTEKVGPIEGIVRTITNFAIPVSK